MGVGGRACRFRGWVPNLNVGGRRHVFVALIPVHADGCDGDAAAAAARLTGVGVHGPVPSMRPGDAEVAGSTSPRRRARR